MKSNSLLMTFTIAASLLVGAPQLQAQTRGQQTPAQNAQAQNDQARVLFGQGSDLWYAGNFVDAEKKFREALRRYPTAQYSDRTSFFLIATLIELARADEALSEIQKFNRAYPNSPWKTDVEEKRLSLYGPSRSASAGYHVATGSIPVPPAPPRVVAPPTPFSVILRVTPSPSLEHEHLRIAVQKDANQGIAIARERLKANPSDPAVIATFGEIAGSGSPQAFPFFVVVLAGKGPSPNMWTQAEFSLGRLKNDNDAVGKGLLEIVKEKDGVPIVSGVFTRIQPATTQKVLNQVVEVPSVDKLVALEKVYKGTPAQPVRIFILQSVGSIPETAARDFLMEVAKTERNMTVRTMAMHVLATRPDVDEKTLNDIFETVVSPARPGMRGQISRGGAREFRDQSTVQLAP